MEENVIITINGEQFDTGDDPDSFELTTDGSFAMMPGGKSVIKYSDGEDAETYKSFETRFTVEPDRIILRRTTWSGAEMIFDVEAKTHFLFETPFGAVAMGVRTEAIKKDLASMGGDLFIKYSLDIDDIVVSRNSFKINIKPSLSQKPSLAQKKKFSAKS